MNFAKRFLLFIKATIIGGVFVMAPVVILVFVIGEALTMAHKVVKPVMELLPVHSIGGISLALLAAIVALIAVCFVAGLFANTTMAKWFVDKVEMLVLSHLPGYTLVKSMGESVAGVDHNAGRKVALVHFSERSQVGFVMDQVADGRLVVFIPNSPSPWTGAIQIVTPDRVEYLSAPIQEVVERLQRLGVGLGPALAKRSPGPDGDPPRNH